MPAQSFIYVANWKMQRPFTEAIRWITGYARELDTLVKHNTLVLCPSYTELAVAVHFVGGTGIQIGAQNCAPATLGAFTGEVSAQSLYELGCSYCIIGHSERRLLFHETDELVAEKLHQLLEHEIIPIVCIGETLEQLQRGQRETVLHEQLDLIIQEALEWKRRSICIAYEPIWAIGTDSIPEIREIEHIIGYVRQVVDAQKSSITWRLLYGGSVSAAHAAELKKITGLDGFLIGSASLDFQELKKIVS